MLGTVDGLIDGIELGGEKGTVLGLEDGIELGSYGAYIPPPHSQHAKYGFFPLYHTLIWAIPHNDVVTTLHPY